MKKISSLILLVSLAFNLSAQEKKNLEFETVYDVEATAVKSQGRTGTCWSFSTISFLEAEALRLTGKKYDLSEMYNARMVYPEKAKNFVGRQGTAQFGEGSLNHDAMKVVKNYGIVPENVYGGKLVNNERYDHAELFQLLDSYLKTLVKNPAGELSNLWLKGFESILDAYLGEAPEKFNYEGKEYTPASFRDMLKIKAENYVQFTSFESAPYYEKMIINIPDNWANGSFYNLPLDEYQEVVIEALKKGYSVAIDSDVSEKGFSSSKGLARVPKMDVSRLSRSEVAELLDRDIEEVKVDAKLRQEELNNYNTTDDHLMHITGLLKDNNGVIYFKVKNSWGTDGQGNEGNVYFSESFFRLKSISVMMHKDAVNKKLRKKLNI